MQEYTNEEWQRLIDRYRREFSSQYAAAVTPPTPTPPSASSPQTSEPIPTPDPLPEPEDELSDIGSLQVRVTTSGDAVPIAGAVVTVSTLDSNGNRELVRVMITDESGITETLDLATKDRALSQIPGNSTPYTSYTVDVTADGYFHKRFIGLPIYGGVTAVQNAVMIPLPEAGGDDRILSYPQSGPTQL